MLFVRGERQRHRDDRGANQIPAPAFRVEGAHDRDAEREAAEDVSPQRERRERTDRERREPADADRRDQRIRERCGDECETRECADPGAEREDFDRREDAVGEAGTVLHTIPIFREDMRGPARIRDLACA